jgi:phage tail-like protein
VLRVSLYADVVETVPIGGRVLTIGRLPDNALVLSHPKVSRHHAELRVAANGALLTDLGSSAGTFVGGTRLLANQPVVLEPGDRVEIGPYSILYEISTPLAPTPPAPRPPVEPTWTPPTLDEDVIPEVQRRETFDVPTPDPASPSLYLQHLPVLFHDNEFLRGFLLVFESVWEPLEWRQSLLPQYFAPSTCPATFLPWLASWLHLTLNPFWPEQRQRQLLAEAMELYRWRGTAYGMTRMIEVCTGITPVITQPQPFVFRIVVSIPSGSDARPELIEELVRAHKPAHVGYVLEVTT